MNGTHRITMGDRGRVVVPADVRERVGLAEGDSLTLIESADGLVLLTRAQLQRLVREDLAGLDLVSDLLADRRAADAIESADAEKSQKLQRKTGTRDGKERRS